MIAISAIDVMKEEHDDSGVGLFLTDLGGEFQNFQEEPSFFGLFSNEVINTLDRFMINQNFIGKYEFSIKSLSALQNKGMTKASHPFVGKTPFYEKFN